jgi:opacity protein-like surface antigen
MQRLSLGVLLVMTLAWLPRTARAQAHPSSQPPGQALHATTAAAPPWSNRGHWNFGLQVGYGVENAIPNNISHVNLLIVQPQLGLIVRDFHRGPLQRFEIVTEGLLGNAVHPGGHLWGNSLFFRFDGKGRTNLVPFLDLGAGMMHTTLNTRVPEVSGRLQFMPQAGLGIQYFFSPQRALVFEYRYFHMSNAGIQQPNDGFNGSMLTIGFRWLRRPRPAPAEHAGR